MILIDKILVNEEIIETNFHCDLKQCKGACCTFKSEFGAPINEDEIPIIEEILPVAFEYLTKKSINVIKSKGFYEGTHGNYSTVCIDAKDCVFVFYEGEIAKCALEKAYFDGKSKFRKPLSCHLFPIRVSDFGGEYIFYSQFSECAPALKLGDRKEIKIYQFVKDSLIRAYGENWYEILDTYVQSQSEKK